MPSQCLLISVAMLAIARAARFRNAADSTSLDVAQSNLSSHSSAGLCCCWKGSCTREELAKPTHSQHVWQSKQSTKWYCCKSCAAGCMGGCPFGTKPPEDHSALKTHFLNGVQGALNQHEVLKNIKHHACPSSSAMQLPNGIAKQPASNQVAPLIQSSSNGLSQPVRPVVQMTLNSLQERKSKCDQLVELWQSEDARNDHHRKEEYEKVLDNGNSLFQSLARHCGKTCSPASANRFVEKSCDNWGRFRTRATTYLQQNPQAFNGVADQYKEIHAAGLDLGVRISVYSFGPFGGGAHDKLEYSQQHFGLKPDKLAPEYKFLYCAERWYPVSPYTLIVPSTCDA